jgi:hypothetical protein
MPPLQSSLHNASRVLASGGMNYDAGCFLIKMAMPTTKNPAPSNKQINDHFDPTSTQGPCKAPYKENKISDDPAVTSTPNRTLL